MTKANKFDLLMGFGRALDLVKPQLHEHNLRVAYLATKIGEMHGLNSCECSDLFIASMLHNIGELTQKFSALTQFIEPAQKDYCVSGWNFCRLCGISESISDIILYRQTPWKNLSHQNPQCIAANCLYLADTFDCSLILHPAWTLKEILKPLYYRPDDFSLQALLCLNEVIYQTNSILLQNDTIILENTLRKNFEFTYIYGSELLAYCRMLSKIIDSKSPFTATHSYGVANTSKEILRLTSLASSCELEEMYIAGLLHDIGKLGTPLHILEKPEALSAKERAIMEGHVATGVNLLGTIRGFECVKIWTGMHHEKLNGNGYPYGYEQYSIPLPARILAVADVFTAMTEDRPYRKKLKLPQVISNLERMAIDKHLDREVVSLLLDNIINIEGVRITSQAKAREIFKQLNKI